MYEDLPCPRAALEHLRSNREGVLLADGLAHQVRFVIDGGTARIVFPTHPHCLAASEMVLFVPQEDPLDEPELQLLLASSELDPLHDEACDRWKAYHGEPYVAHWAGCEIESARFSGEVIDESLLCRPNPLHRAEPRLCKLLNRDPRRLIEICERRCGTAPRDPVAVGVDCGGVDIRARFGIMRLPFEREANTEAEAQAMIECLAASRA